MRRLVKRKMRRWLDRYAAWNMNSVPLRDPHSGPRRAKRARRHWQPVAGSAGPGSPTRVLRVGVEDIKGGARDWLEFLRASARAQARRRPGVVGIAKLPSSTLSCGL